LPAEAQFETETPPMGRAVRKSSSISRVSQSLEFEASFSDVLYMAVINAGQRRVSGGAAEVITNGFCALTLCSSG
jgi:hypothetical protein